MTFMDPIERGIQNLPLRSPSADRDALITGMLADAQLRRRPSRARGVAGRIAYAAAGLAAGLLAMMLVQGVNGSEPAQAAPYHSPAVAPTPRVAVVKAVDEGEYVKYKMSEFSDEGMFEVRSEDRIAVTAPDGTMALLDGPARFKVDRIGDAYDLRVSKGGVRVSLAEDALSEIRVSFREPVHESIPFASYHSIVNSSQPLDYKEIQRYTAAKNHEVLGDF